MTENLGEQLLDQLQALNCINEPLVGFSGSVRARRRGEKKELQLPPSWRLAQNAAFVLDEVSRRIWGRKGIRNAGGLSYVGTLREIPAHGETGTTVRLVLTGLWPETDIEMLRTLLAAYWAKSFWGGLHIETQPLWSIDDARGWIDASAQSAFVHPPWFTNLPIEITP